MAINDKAINNLINYPNSGSVWVLAIYAQWVKADETACCYLVPSTSFNISFVIVYSMRRSAKVTCLPSSVTV
jgi:hypothetical protein